MSAAGVIFAVLIAVPASAQSWWPFGGNDDNPPRPSEPVRRPEPQAIPAPIPQPAPVQNGAAAGGKNPICLQLEQRLVQEGQKGSQWREQIPKIEAEIRQVDQAFNVGSNQLDRSCYETFFFQRTFRSTPQCKELSKQVEGSKRRLQELETQRQDLISSGGRSYQDDIVRELARNNCGANYADQARRHEGGGMWQDEEAIGSNTWNPQGGGGATTYRTICVRSCDGFYFPVSFSTLPSHFPQDAEVCGQKCSAPSELYYYPNPGGSVEQSVALASQEPYAKQKFAFRYRKEYVSGCSCKEAEYVPPTPVAGKNAELTTSATRTSATVQHAPEPALKAKPPQPAVENGWEAQ